MDIYTQDRLSEAEQIAVGLKELSQILGISVIPATEEVFLVMEIAIEKMLLLLQEIRSYEVKQITQEDMK